jgi:hypothetical protein
MCTVGLKAKRVCAAALVWALLAPAAPAAGGEGYELAFSTYVGGENWEHARDVCSDKDGNVYVVGGTASGDFPTTGGAYDRTFGFGGEYVGDAGPCDAFVMKFSPEGELVWSTLLGGPNYDRAYGVEVDSTGYVCVAGRAGPGFPVSEGAFQTDYCGTRDSGLYGFYGSQNGFVAKLSPDGQRLVWSSYVGVGELCRDIAVDADGDIYLPLAWGTWSDRVEAPGWFATAFVRAFQKRPAGGTDCGVVKVTGDGSRVVWATWLGGSGRDTQEASIRVDAQERAVIVLTTWSADMPTTEDALAQKPGGDSDGYVAMVTPDGSGLVYGTYVGGGGRDWAISTHNLAVDGEGNAYAAVITRSPDFPTTPGAYRRGHAGGTDVAIVKLSPTGSLLRSSFVGGKGDDGADGIDVDAAGNVFFAGNTRSTDFDTTLGAFQAGYGGGEHDAVVVLLSADFGRLLYSTYMGGTAFDVGRSACLGPDGSLYVTGAANGPGWPVRNAFQAEFAGTDDPRWGNGDCLLARFRPTVPAAQGASPEAGGPLP